jgi:3-(3-hydroxy-phenyl)propionate hydroxylase
VTVGDRRVRFDELLGDSFVVLAARPLSPVLTAVTRALGADSVDVTGLGDGGVLAEWMRAGRADAVLLRPDRVVMDIVPSGRDDFTDTAGWATLLHTARRPLPAERTVGTSLLRSTTR